jgi:fimbrial chaperone protein
MHRFTPVRSLSVIAIFAAIAAPALNAVAMTVQPVVLDLQSSGRGMNQVVSVINDSAAALPVELNIQQLFISANGTQSTGKDPGDLVVFPPQALIQAGQTQTFRIQYVGGAALIGSKHYQITVAQLPVSLPKGQSRIQVLYNFVVLASVGPSSAKPALRVLSSALGTNGAGKPVPVLTVANDSKTYGYLSRGKLRITSNDQSGREIYRQTFTSAELQQSLGMGLIGSGQQRQFTLPVILPAEGRSVAAQFTPGT